MQKLRRRGTTWGGALFAVSLVATAAVKTLMLTDASSGKTVSAVVGMIVQIDLSPGMVWSEVNMSPMSSADSGAPVLQKLSASTSADGSFHAVFRVVHAGEAHLKAVGRAKCDAAKPCPMFMLQWTVLLTVPDPL